jgi:hypothetical protein
MTPPLKPGPGTTADEGDAAFAGEVDDFDDVIGGFDEDDGFGAVFVDAAIVLVEAEVDVGVEDVVVADDGAEPAFGIDVDH